jgi:hypothetical protein
MRKYLQDRFRALLRLDDPPHELALAFALGVFVAFSPTIGLHTLSCLALGWLFRLNKLVILTAAFINNPWTIVPLYGFCIWFGVKLLGGGVAVPQIPWGELNLTNSYLILKPYLWAFIAGTLVVGAVVAFLSYFLVHAVVVRYRKLEKPRRDRL